MGVFSKLKNIFYDEEVVEEPETELKKVDKEVKREIKEEPKVEEIKVIKPEPIIVPEKEEEKPKLDNTLNERELFRSERKFSFTELDDMEEDALPPRRNVLDIEKSRTVDRVQPASTPVEEPRIFKPSPIISPIYGILDKDYKKEEIVSKKSEPVKEIDSPARNYDSVRRKAYGTLEDELEDTLNSMNKITPEEIKEEVKKEEVKVEEKTTKIEDLITKIEDTENDVSIGELEDKLELENFDEDAKEDEAVDKTMTDSTLEHDLFNLIDSMYDDKEE